MLRSCILFRKGHEATIALASVQLTSLRFWRRQEEERQASSWASEHLKGIHRPAEGGHAPCLPINPFPWELSAQRWPANCGHHSRGREYCTGSQLADQLEKIQGFAEAPKRAAVDEYEVGFIDDLLPFSMDLSAIACRGAFVQELLYPTV